MQTQQCPGHAGEGPILWMPQEWEVQLAQAADLRSAEAPERTCSTGHAHAESGTGSVPRKERNGFVPRHRGMGLSFAAVPDPSPWLNRR